jgi:hypothetical protein
MNRVQRATEHHIGAAPIPRPAPRPQLVVGAGRESARARHQGAGHIRDLDHRIALDRRAPGPSSRPLIDLRDSHRIPYQRLYPRGPFRTGSIQLSHHHHLLLRRRLIMPPRSSSMVCGPSPHHLLPSPTPRGRHHHRPWRPRLGTSSTPQADSRRLRWPQGDGRRRCSSTAMGEGTAADGTGSGEEGEVIGGGDGRDLAGG